VCYDLGAAYFQQGSTNAAVYENAREKFFRTKELIAEVNTVIIGT
jgi:integrator complex subunit 8